MLNDEIIAAYKATNYRVLSDPEFTLRVDEHSEELLKLYELTRANSAAFITAWNPFSEEKSPSENDQTNALLRADIEALGAKILPGFGAWPDDPNNGEDSFLAVGISEHDAIELGKKYRQNAILFVANDATPRLILLVK
ncbi:MAG: DUF3293 domain-containing protein [Hyphomonas sp.]|nr:DUF3293 domain-containing protein [Hyphomonas sp.]